MGVKLLKGNIQKWNLKIRSQKSPELNPGLQKLKNLGLSFPINSCLGNGCHHTTCDSDITGYRDNCSG